jgi:endonuclease YncB( thermonuclease family)
MIIGIGGITIGGSAYQADSPILQSGGVMGMVLGGVSLFFVVRMFWKTIGCLSIMFVVFGIICFALYMCGFFDNGMGGVMKSLGGLFGQQQQVAPAATKPNAQAPQKLGSGFKSKLGAALGGQQPQQQQAPAPVPTITGEPYAISGDVIQVNGYNIRLFGIDAPESDQRCMSRTGRPYHCGQKAANELKRMLGQNNVTCKIMQKRGRNVIGTCSIGAYDLGVALVSSGWAVAYQQYSRVYVPYEEQARNQGKGLWSGQFYMPWDWRAQKSRKAKVKVNVTKQKFKKPETGIIKNDPFSGIFN